MSSKGRRERKTFCNIERPETRNTPDKADSASTNTVNLFEGIQITESVSNRFNREKGYYDSGGPFFTTRVEGFVNPRPRQ